MAPVAHHSWASRAAAAATALLAALELLWAGFSEAASATVGPAVLFALLTLLAATALAKANVFEARFGVGIMCGAPFGLTLLSLMWGLPGLERQPVGVTALVALVLSAAGLALIVVDRRIRARSRPPAHQPPYAL